MNNFISKEWNYYVKNIFRIRRNGPDPTGSADLDPEHFYSAEKFMKKLVYENARTFIDTNLPHL